MDLVLNTSQKLVLSQRMLQSTEILQMSSQELLEYIKKLSVENPVVEYEEKNETDDEKYDLLRQKLEWLNSCDDRNRFYYVKEKEFENSNDMWAYTNGGHENLKEYLISQINVLKLEPKLLFAAKYIIECIDPNGYFYEDIKSISRQINIKENTVKEALCLVQTLEPLGVGARSLKECLLIQMKRLENNNVLAKNIIENDLELLAKNKLHLIARKYKVSMDEVQEASRLIKSLNPKPGNSFFSEDCLEYITPDVVVVKSSDEYEIILNDYFFPNITINNYYKNIISRDSAGSTKEYVYDKIKQAEWAMKCISRRNATLFKTLEIIINLQREFFDKGQGNLNPMKLSDVAERIKMHESTVSRAVRDKYLQCSWGIFPLSYFFTNGMSTDSEKEVTPERIKIVIKEIIEKENKKSPLSDRCITEKLNDMGINISRRTVTKYREASSIMSAAGRRGY